MTFNELTRRGPSLILALMMMGIMTMPAFAVGTVTQAVTPVGTTSGTAPDTRVYQVVVNWTGDASNGSAPSTLLSSIGPFPAMQGMRLISAEIQPGTPSPTTNYSITLTDSAGVDMLGGLGANLSATLSSTFNTLSAPLVGVPTFNLSGNSVNSAQGKLLVYFSPAAQAQPSTTTGAALTTTNTFTGTNIFTGLLECKNFENVRCVDATNAVGWAGTTGDAWINAAITDLATNGTTRGGEVWLAPGIYSIANTIRISTSNIKLKCLGLSHSFNTGGPSCTLNWTGAAAGTVILIDTVNTTNLTGDGLYGFYINCSGVNSAATGISILSAQNGEYEQIDVVGGFTAQGILLGVDASVTNPATGSGTAQNWFRNINVFGGAANAHGWNLTGTATNDVFMNTFHVVAATTTGTGDAWHLENADNNRFFSINGASATGFGLHLTCMASAASQAMCAREDEFFNSNLGSNPIKQDGVSTFYATSNRVYGYEICNGSALPTTSVILKGSLYVDSLDCGDTNFSTRIFATGASGTSFQADDYNYKNGHTISNAVNYTSHIFDSSASGVNKSLQWNDNGTIEWICGFIAGAQWSCFDAVNSQNRLVLGKSGGTNANVYNVPTALTHNFQVNAANIFTINSTNIQPGTAGAVDVGATALPFGNLWLGTAATNNFKVQPATTTGARVITITDPVSPTTVGLPLTIASGTATMTTGAITTLTCGTVVTVAATGVAATDSIFWNDNAQPAAATNGILPIKAWPTAGNVNFFYCNPTAGSVTPAAATLNWRVVR